MRLEETLRNSSLWRPTLADSNLRSHLSDLQSFSTPTFQVRNRESVRRQRCENRANVRCHARAMQTITQVGLLRTRGRRTCKRLLIMTKVEDEGPRRFVRHRCR